MKRLFTKNGSLLMEADNGLAYFEVDTYPYSKKILIKTPYQTIELELETDSFGDQQVSKISTDFGD